MKPLPFRSGMIGVDEENEIEPGTLMCVPMGVVFERVEAKSSWTGKPIFRWEQRGTLPYSVVNSLTLTNEQEILGRYVEFVPERISL